MHQRAHSLDTVWRSNWTLGRAPSNTQALRCFQISHVTRMMREFRPLWRSFGTDFIVKLHQAEKLVVEVAGPAMTKFRCWDISDQHCRVNTQVRRRCLAVSCSWSQRGQAAWWGRPRLARRSAVQMRCLMANQRKNLQRRGAQLFQFRFQIVNINRVLFHCGLQFLTELYLLLCSPNRRLDK